LFFCISKGAVLRGGPFSIYEERKERKKEKCKKTESRVRSFASHSLHALPAGFVSFSKAKKKEPKKNAFSSLAAFLHGQESDPIALLPDRNTFASLRPRSEKPQLAIGHLLSLRRFDAGDG